VDLSNNTNLRRIHVHQLILYHLSRDMSLSFSLAPNQARPRSPYYWLIPILSEIRSSHLEELVFVLWLSAESQLRLIDWVAMTELLLSAPFSSLKGFRFEIMGMGRDREKVRTWLETRLSQWTASEATLQVKFIEGY
jgi:hypothetical protein